MSSAAALTEKLYFCHTKCICCTYIYYTCGIRIACAIAFAINIQIKITHIDLFTAVAFGMQRTTRIFRFRFFYLSSIRFYTTHSHTNKKTLSTYALPLKFFVHFCYHISIQIWSTDQCYIEYKNLRQVTICHEIKRNHTFQHNSWSTWVQITVNCCSRMTYCPEIYTIFLESFVVIFLFERSDSEQNLSWSDITEVM